MLPFSMDRLRKYSHFLKRLFCGWTTGRQCGNARNAIPGILSSPEVNQIPSQCSCEETRKREVKLRAGECDDCSSCFRKKLCRDVKRRSHSLGTRFPSNGITVNGFIDHSTFHLRPSTARFLANTHSWQKTAILLRCDLANTHFRRKKQFFIRAN